MKERLKNNIVLKIMAVLFAIFLWWAVVNIDDPIDTGTYNVAVAVTNPEVITNEGKSYQIIDDTQSISVTVKARRKVLAELEAENIIATADLRERQDTSVPIRISISGFEGLYEEATANPRNIQVQVENTQKKTFPIITVANGTPREGYVVGSMIASPKTVDISGPESSIAKISKVVANVDVSELAQNTTVQSVLVYYDAADNVIDKSQLTSNCDKNGASVEITIWKTKEVQLSFDTSAIAPAEGYVFTDIEVEPEIVEVAGSPSVLSNLSQLVIKADELEVVGLAGNQEVVIDITQYLPEGVSLVDSAAGQVVVRILVEQAGTKSIRLAVRSITVANVADDLQLGYGPEQEVELIFEGTNEALENLTSEKIVATIDLSAYKEIGTYDVPVQITDLPIDCNYIGETTVQIVLSKK